MRDIITILQDLRRPRLLIQAARIGSEQYQRSVHLPRILGFGSKAKGTAALLKLIEIEETLNEQRLNSDAAYSAATHVEVLCAMMGEARILRVARRETLHLV